MFRMIIFINFKLLINAEFCINKKVFVHNIYNLLEKEDIMDGKGCSTMHAHCTLSVILKIILNLVLCLH